jgi:Ca-activated chloride channel family protein
MAVLQRLLATFILCLSLFISMAGIDAELGTSARAENCDPASQRKISLSVQDREGRFVDTLRPEDLTISVDKVSREILKLERQTNEPLSVAILIDTSASQERILAGTKLAAERFVESILRSNKNRAALVSFTGEATVEQDLTNDLTKLRAAIARVKVVPLRGSLLGGVVLGPTPPSRAQTLAGSTAIWDAIWATVDGIHPAAGSRLGIVLLTDGQDTVSKTKLREAIGHAAANDVAIFSIGIADNNFVNLNRDSLKKLSEETGGRAFFPKKIADLDAIFIETTQALQSQYVLSYCAANPKPAAKPLKIEVGIKNPQLRQSNLRLSYPHYGL